MKKNKYDEVAKLLLSMKRDEAKFKRQLGTANTHAHAMELEVEDVEKSFDIVVNYVKDLERRIISSSPSSIGAMDELKKQYHEKHSDMALFAPDEHDIEVSAMHMIKHKSTRAFVDIKIGRLTLKGFRVVERHDKSLFVSLPSQFDEKEERFFPTVIPVREKTTRSIEKCVLKAYAERKEV
jgi:DNA-binding cell septation regulator SpoVG